jgi:hypothetical protein
MEYSLYETARKTGLSTRNHRAGGWTNPRAGRVKTRWQNGFYACLVDFTSPTQQKKWIAVKPAGFFCNPRRLPAAKLGFAEAFRERMRKKRVCARACPGALAVCFPHAPGPRVAGLNRLATTPILEVWNHSRGTR